METKTTLPRCPYYLGILSYYTHFEITGDPCNLIGSHQCDLFMNHTIALNHSCSNSHHVLNRVISVLNHTIFALYCSY